MITTEKRISHIISDYADLHPYSPEASFFPLCFLNIDFTRYFENLKNIFKATETFGVFQIGADSKDKTVYPEHMKKSRAFITAGADVVLRSRMNKLSVAIFALGDAEPIEALAKYRNVERIKIFSFPRACAEKELKRVDEYSRRKCQVVEADLSGGMIYEVAAIFARYTKREEVEAAIVRLYDTFPIDERAPNGERFDYVISSLVGTQLVYLTERICKDLFKKAFGATLSIQHLRHIRCKIALEWDYTRALATYVRETFPHGYLYFADTGKLMTNFLNDERSLMLNERGYLLYCAFRKKPAPPPSFANPFLETISAHFEISLEMTPDEWAYRACNMRSPRDIYIWTSAYLLIPKEQTK